MKWKYEIIHEHFSTNLLTLKGDAPRIYTSVHSGDSSMDNRIIARRLLDMAHSLEEKHANFYRVKAYRRAAETVLGLDRPVEDIVAGAGRKALKQLPGIGGSMSE